MNQCSGERPRQVVTVGSDVCDFCGTTTPAKKLRLYPCTDFVAQVVIRDRLALGKTCPCHPRIKTHTSDTIIETPTSGAWTACPACQEYIDRGDERGLAIHVVAQSGGTVSDLPMYVVDPLAGTMRQASETEQVKAALSMFWLHRLPEN